MFRIREAYVGQSTVCIWVDGRLNDRDIEHFRSILAKYRSRNNRVIINLSQLSHISWEGKRFLHEILDQVELVDIVEHLRMEIMPED